MNCERHDLPQTPDDECAECRIERLQALRPGRTIEEPSELLPTDYDVVRVWLGGSDAEDE